METDLEKARKSEVESREEEGHLRVDNNDVEDDTLSTLTLTGPSGDTPFDLERFLRKAMKQIEKAEHIEHRELGVYFKDLRVTGLGASASHQPTVGSLLSPSAQIGAINDIRHPEIRTIIEGFEGVVRPGEMLLVLGSPGSGCTTLLKTLSNQTDGYHDISGDRHFASLTPDKLARHHRGDVQYCPEDDIHFPTLTVAQTLLFAAKTRTPSNRLDGMKRKAFEEHWVKILLNVFGLEKVADTKVGDAYIRGISGGQKKRVSLAEVLATRCLIGSWDGATKGLDASTALEFIQTLRIATDAARMTTIVSIYQAGESLYELFDKVCVIYEGKMAYFGSTRKARDYFIEMGYEPANRQTTADFLVAVTDPNGRIPRSIPPAHPVPRTAAEFAAYFKNHPLSDENRADMQDYYNEHVGNPEKLAAYKRSVTMEHADHVRDGSPFTISLPMQARALMLRRYQILKGQFSAVLIDMFAFVVQAILNGTIFFRLKNTTASFYSRGGVLFFAILFSALTSMSEIPSLFAQRPIVLRHFKAAMYHPFADSIALTLVDVPVTLITLVMFAILLYFLVGLQETAGQFFVFFLFIVTMSLTMKAWTRAVTSVFKTAAPAQTIAGSMVLVLTLYTGYMIPQPSMIGALKWLTYINPLKYAFEALMTNELHAVDAQCSTLIPSGPGYENVSLENQVCTVVGSQSGHATVSGAVYASLSYGYSYSHLWRNFGISVAFGVAFLASYWTLTELNTRESASANVTWFKRGSKAHVANNNADDAEKGPASSTASTTNVAASEPKTELPTTLVMTDIFSWQHLEYVVPLADGSHRKLLDDVSGYVAPGKLTALMGESGAGKTTLLNVLAERTDVGVIRGDRFVNGHQLPADFGAQTGYCQQQDTHLPTQTVREALLFSAKMRQPASVPLSEKEAYVERCLQLCGLEEHGDAIVGTLNVEMRKRTTIAVELVAKPRLLLFLDEPTSGLDSQSAWAIVSFLRELADKAGQAILCTIHQPSGELFEVFDRLLLLKVGGQTVYFGDLGHHSNTLIQYFERNGARHCRDEENPAEYILQVIGAGATALVDRDWHEVWKNSPEARGVQEDIERIHAEGRQRGAVETTLKSEFATSWSYQVLTLLQRDAESHWRDPTYIMAKLALNIVAGLLIGFTFFKAKDSIQGTQNKIFAIFIATILTVPLAQQLQVPFIHMRSLYEARERPSRMYSWSALITSQILVEIPWNVLGSSLFYFCWYWTVGLDSIAYRAGYVYLVLGVLMPLYYITLGQAVAALSSNEQIAALLFNLLFSFVTVFNGVLQPFRALGWWKWMYHVSPYTYVVEGLLGAAIGRKEVSCAPVEVVSVTPPSGLSCQSYLQSYIDANGGYLVDNGSSTQCGVCPYRTTDQFLFKSFNIQYSHRWRNVGIFIGFIAINTIGIYLLSYLVRYRKGSVIASLKKRLQGKKSSA